MSGALKSAYATLVLFAIFIVVGGKFPGLGRAFIAQGSGGDGVGELYQMCQLDRFREEIPTLPPQAQESLGGAQVLTLGDSFFNTSLGSGLFATELASRSGLKVRNLESQSFPEPQTYPLAFLESIGYQPDRKRILILETVERYAPTRSDHYCAAAGSGLGLLNMIYNKVFDHSDLEYFFKNNVAVYPLARWLKNIKFNYFKIIDKSIGSYSEKPNMLFYQEDLEFANRPKTEAMIDSIAANVARLSEQLKLRYGLDLIYVVVPNKYSIYHGLVHNGYSYDGFLPKLSRKLTQKGVKHIDLYALYCLHNEPGMPFLYYASDTHYTPAGKALLVQECARVIGALREGN